MAPQLMLAARERPVPRTHVQAGASAAANAWEQAHGVKLAEQKLAPKRQSLQHAPGGARDFLHDLPVCHCALALRGSGLAASRSQAESKKRSVVDPQLRHLTLRGTDTEPLAPTAPTRPLTTKAVHQASTGFV